MTKEAEEAVRLVTILAAREAVDANDLGHMASLWNAIQAEAWYDPRSPVSQAFAVSLLPHIDALNAKFKFKR